MATLIRSIVRRLNVETAKKNAQRISYFLKTGYLHTGERVNPDLPDEHFDNHLKVYKFAAQFARGMKVLDMGCGTGYGSQYLAQVAASVDGIDISSAAIRLARKKYKGPTFQKMDACELRFPDATFDFIISTENFEHLKDQAKNVREIRRVLKPRGIALVASPNPEMFVGHRNRYHTKENSFGELKDLFCPVFPEVEIIENQLPHNLNRPHGLTVKQGDPLMLFGENVDTTWLHNTHSFMCFCR